MFKELKYAPLIQIALLVVFLGLSFWNAWRDSDLVARSTATLAKQSEAISKQQAALDAQERALEAQDQALAAKDRLIQALTNIKESQEKTIKYQDASLQIYRDRDRAF